MPSGPSYSLAQDPAYLAFLRASGLTEQIALGDAARRRDNINQALGISLGDLDAGGEKERRGISASQEDRGVFRSGQTLQRMSEQEEDQARRREAIELAGVGQLGDIETNLLTTLAGQQTKGAEYGLTLAGDRAYNDGLTSLAASPLTAPAATYAAPAATNTAPAAPVAAAPTAPFTASPKRRTGRQQEY